MTTATTKSKPKNNHILRIAISLSIAFTLFLGLMFLTSYESEYVNDRTQLDGFDFSSGLALISPVLFDRYNHALYTPEDFAAGVSTTPENVLREHSEFSTYRLLLDLPDGVVFGLSGNSPGHSMALWIDGTLRQTYGKPGTTAETTEGGLNYFTVYFAAGDERWHEGQTTSRQTEIVIQHSAVVRADGGWLFPLYLGEASLIESMNSLNKLRTGSAVGITVMAAILLLSIFIFFNNRPHFLWFSLACLMIAVRTTATEFMVIPRDNKIRQYLGYP